MKIKDDFVLRRVANTWTVLPLSAEVLNFDGMLTLNESGAMLWNVLIKGADFDMLVDALLNEYDVTREQALTDAEEFLNMLKSVGCIEDV